MMAPGVRGPTAMPIQLTAGGSTVATDGGPRPGLSSASSKQQPQLPPSNNWQTLREGGMVATQRTRSVAQSLRACTAAYIIHVHSVDGDWATQSLLATTMARDDPRWASAKAEDQRSVEAASSSSRNRSALSNSSTPGKTRLTASLSSMQGLLDCVWRLQRGHGALSGCWATSHRTNRRHHQQEPVSPHSRHKQ